MNGKYDQCATGACELDLEMLLSSGALTAHRKRGLIQMLLDWLSRHSPF